MDNVLLEYTVGDSATNVMKQHMCVNDVGKLDPGPQGKEPCATFCQQERALLLGA